MQKVFLLCFTVEKFLSCANGIPGTNWRKSVHIRFELCECRTLRIGNSEQQNDGTS